ncbi:MAG: hypothetical protein WA584_22710 [Pyrinomonadaceae bacterium]
MAQNKKANHIPHNDPKIAYHMDWGVRREAAFWINERPIRVNFYPFATELRNWLLRQPADLRLFSSDENSFSNPYTKSASVLVKVYTVIINDCAYFTESSELINSYEAETKRIRLYNELVLYTARLCEVLIKQLLFCTTFAEKDYKNAALGSLLSRECSGCRNSKSKRHKLSFLGSLFHRYYLCHAYEGCLNEHLSIAKRRRDTEAAHSGTTDFVPKPISEVRNQLGKELIEIGEDFIHMLRHISEVEKKMSEELFSLITDEAQKLCPLIKAEKSDTSNSESK